MFAPSSTTESIYQDCKMKTILTFKNRKSYTDNDCFLSEQDDRNMTSTNVSSPTEAKLETSMSSFESTSEGTFEEASVKKYKQSISHPSYPKKDQLHV